MRIAYPLYMDVGKERGALKKIVEQASVWISQGAEVKLFVQWPSADIWPGLNQVPVQVFPPTSFMGRFSKDSFGVKRVIAWKPDLVYLRFGTFFPPFGFLMDRIPTVLEINTDDLTEYRLQRSMPKYWYHRLTRGQFLRRAIGLVFVTRKLSRKPSFTRYGKPGLVLANGIDLSRYPRLPPPDNPNPRLVFMGSGGDIWHGVEKIISLAKHFPEWRFDIIGYSQADIGEPAQPNVVFHVHLDRIQYEPLMAQANVAIGTLAYHKIRMDEGCPLKTREYLAYGIPTIIGYRDTDFQEGHPLILELPNTPDNVDTHFDKIRDFVYRVKGTRVDRASIACIDTKHKELNRLEFFVRLLRQM